MERHKGFTLLEILVALLIMSLLAGIALQSYQHALMKSRRVEGRVALMALMQEQERHYSLHTTYFVFSADLPVVNTNGRKWFSGKTAQASFYELSAQACDDNGVRQCIQLIARPGTNKVNASYRDPLCGTLRLDSRGHMQADADGCW
jgi:type IV pilus assembly protein PilE